MSKKRGYFKQLMYDFFHLHELMPNKINVYVNEKEGIEAFEIHQPKNQYVKQNVKYLKDDKKGIFKLQMFDDDGELIEYKE